jgi:hypothetical protein
MYKLIDRARIALEIAHKLLVLPAFLERREADLLIYFTASAILPTCRVALSDVVFEDRWGQTYRNL